MSKRVREASLSLESESDGSPRLTDKHKCEALEEHASYAKQRQIGTHASSPYIHSMLTCALAPHRETICFSSHEEHGVHYVKEHTNRCTTCSKNFPSSRFLELHIEENHNALREVLAARGERTYGCFVEGCDRMCSTAQKRRLHLVDKHMFPKKYDFRIVNQGIDERSSMLQGQRRLHVATSTDRHQPGKNLRQKSFNRHHQQRNIKINTEQTCQDSLTEDDEHMIARANLLAVPGSNRTTQSGQATGNVPDEVEPLTHALSALRFVPASVLRNQARESIDADVNHERGDRTERPL
jgi:hypothetical protein